MLIIPSGVKIHLALGHTDMRKGFDGLAVLVQAVLKKDPFSGVRRDKAAQFRVIRICRPKYSCRACRTVSQAPAPERPIAGGMATPALLAQVLVSKYCDHTPLYRQSQIFARLGVDLDRSTLAAWVGGACWWLDALYERLCANVFASDHLFADDTPVPVLDPGRGRTKTGRLWVYARDQRSWGGPAAPAAIFVYAPDRKSERPAAHLENFSGILHVDGYAGFARLRARGDVTLAACWIHMRRNFYEFFEATNSPVAAEAPRRIGELYAIEERIRGQSPALRLAERRTFSKPLVEKLKVWFEQQLSGAARQACRRDPLCTEALGRPHAIPARWSRRARYQSGGARNPSRCTGAQESSFCGF